MRQKKLVEALLAVVLIGIMAPCAKAQDISRKVLIAYAGLISTHTSVWLAEDQGFYKKHGLDVTSVFISSGSVTSQALIAGEAKLASTSVGPTAGAVSGGADLVILAGTIHILPYQFWVLPQVRQPADLKGKRVAISTFGSGSHLAAEVALHSLGLEPVRDKIAIMQVGTQPDRVAALASGRIDATPLGAGLWAGGKRSRTHRDARYDESRCSISKHGARCVAPFRQRKSSANRSLCQRQRRRVRFPVQSSQ